MKQHGSSDRKRKFLSQEPSDGTTRAASHFNLVSGNRRGDDLGETLVAGAKQSNLSKLVAMHPIIAPLADELPGITSAHEREGVTLQFVRREEGVKVMNISKAGFFGIWKKTSALPERLPL